MPHNVQNSGATKSNHNKAGVAVEYLMKGFMCSSAVVMAYVNEMGLDPQIAAKIASGFAGGMVQGKTCGAVTGAIMVIGMKYGPRNSQDLYARELCIQIIQEFFHRFTQCHNSLECAEILAMHHINFWNPNDMKNLREKGLCEKIVKDSALILEELFAEEI